MQIIFIINFFVIAIMTLICGSSGFPCGFYSDLQLIEEFTHGVQHLQELNRNHHFVEENFNDSLYETIKELEEEFDFVIIGAGASGSVIANRLSENPKWKILILEAGGHETPYTRIPKFEKILYNTPYNWGYTTTKQTTWCQGMINNKCQMPSARILGGGTSFGTLYTRGHPNDFDLWSELGNEGWNYQEVLPYFKKAENVHLKTFDKEYHQHGGPLSIEDPYFKTNLTRVVPEAGEVLGIAKTLDYNGKEQLGFGVPQFTTKHGTKFSTSEAYLEPASDRENLIVRPFSYVIKLVMEPNSKRVLAVDYVKRHKLFRVKVKREVILSAGAIGTPKLLMLSGIGPRDHLEAVGVPVMENLPGVGLNFKDHIAYNLEFIYNETCFNDAPSGTIDDILEYLQNGTGVLTNSGTDMVGFLQIKELIEYPDIKLDFTNQVLGYEYHQRYRQDIYDRLWKPFHGLNALTIKVTLLHPSSSGTIRLKNKNPLQVPLIDANQLSTEDDLKTMISGIRLAQKIVDTPQFQALGLVLNQQLVTGCEGTTFGTDQYWTCALRTMSVSLGDYSGTTKMANEYDEFGVVDWRLRVNNIANLRVADMSVVPVTISGNHMATAILIGEKASDLIKEELDSMESQAQVSKFEVWMVCSWFFGCLRGKI